MYLLHLPRTFKNHHLVAFSCPKCKSVGFCGQSWELCGCPLAIAVGNVNRGYFLSSGGGAMNNWASLEDLGAQQAEDPHVLVMLPGIAALLSLEKGNLLFFPSCPSASKSYTSEAR